MPGFPSRTPTRAQEAPYYFEVELSAEERIVALRVTREALKRIPTSSAARGMVERLEAALLTPRRMDIPLRRERLDWGDVEADARRQGVGPADVIWDRAKAREP